MQVVMNLKVFVFYWPFIYFFEGMGCVTSTSWLDIDGDPNHDADTGILNGFNYLYRLGAIQRMRKRANCKYVADLVALADICCLRVLL